MAFSGAGAGSVGDPYQITDVDELQEMKDTLGAYYLLMNDIDCSDTTEWNTTGSGSNQYYQGFDPIGQTGARFTGGFDGGGFTLSNLYMNWNVAAKNVALFGYIDPPAGAARLFKDVTIENADITNQYSGLNASIFCSNAAAASGTDNEFSDIHVSGSITSANSASGLVQSASATNCTDCSANINITSAVYANGFGSGSSSAFLRCTAGGSINIVGTTASMIASGFGGGTGGSTFVNCKATVAISITNTTSDRPVLGAGGFSGTTTSATFTNCYASGVIQLNVNGNVHVGGFVGDGTGCTFIECAASVDIICPVVGQNFGHSYIGGFSGSYGTMTDCYARGDVCKSGIKNNTTAKDVYIAGFIGINKATTSYSTGIVGPDNTGSGNAVLRGGFVGSHTASCTACFWDTDTSGMALGAGAGTETGLTGKTTVLMKTEATFIPAGAAAGQWDFTSTWKIDTFTQPAVIQSNLTVWLSKTGDYHNFEEGLKDDDSFAVTIPTTNEIRWLKGLEALIVGTSAGEWKIASNKLDTPLSPTAYSAKRQTTYGSAAIQALAINSSLLFVDYVGRKIREITYTPSEEKYVAPDMSELAEHVTLGGITSIAHQRNPNSILWAVRADGVLLSMVYDREQSVVAWSEHVTDGTVQSVCVVPGPTYDVVWVSVTRTSGTYIERLMPRDFGTDVADAFFVDSGVTATSPGNTMGGLTHLAGQTVIVMGDGVEQEEETAGDFVVTVGGIITLPTGNTLTTVHAGLPYTWKVQPMRIVIGSADGTSFGSITRVSELVVSFLNSKGVKYGDNDSNLFDINFDDIRWEDEAYTTGLFSGDVVVSMPGGFSVNNPIILSGSGPYPTTVRAIIARILKTGR